MGGCRMTARSRIDARTCSARAVTASLRNRLSPVRSGSADDWGSSRQWNRRGAQTTKPDCSGSARSATERLGLEPDETMVAVYPVLLEEAVDKKAKVPQKPKKPKAPKGDTTKK